MVKAFNKKESKRMTCHKKYKIRKKVREHNKKLAKTLKNSVKKKRKIDGNVPNLAPFKEGLLLEAIQQNEMKNEEKLKKKTKTPVVIKKPKSDTPQAISSKSVSSHVTISQCDIIIWVIDIRSAAECYSEETFVEIKNANKSVVVVLNKADLVPSTVVHYWYSFYCSKTPTFVTKSTEVILTECEQIIPALKQTVAKFGGAKPLLNHLKQSFTEDIKKIGVIGGAQVGKSCVISTLLKCCGRTKAKKTSETKLNENLKLVTVPGLVKIEYKGILQVLQNMQQHMNHPVEVLRALSVCISKQDAMYSFTLPDYSHPDGLLDALAVRYNQYYNKEPDHVAVARLILKQLRDKKLKFYVGTEDAAAALTEIPADILEDVGKFLFRGDALKIRSSELNIVITKKEKKKRNNEMEVDEESEKEDEGDIESSEEEEEEDSLNEEEDMC